MTSAVALLAFAPAVTGAVPIIVLVAGLILGMKKTFGSGMRMAMVWACLSLVAIGSMGIASEQFGWSAEVSTGTILIFMGVTGLIGIEWVAARYRKRTKPLFGKDGSLDE